MDIKRVSVSLQILETEQLIWEMVGLGTRTFS